MTNFENTGAGFFSTVVVPPNAGLIADRSPLDGAYGAVDGVDFDMGFVVFLENGRVSLIEGYSHGATPTADINFAQVAFDLKPWSAAKSD